MAADTRSTSASIRKSSALRLDLGAYIADIGGALAGAASVGALAGVASAGTLLLGAAAVSGGPLDWLGPLAVDVLGRSNGTLIATLNKLP